MGHTHAIIYLHITFATKDRRPAIKDLGALGKYIACVANTHGAHLVTSGGMPDHIHLLLQLPTTISVGELISKLKANSSRVLGENFQWQHGYSAFSISASGVVAVRQYIENQPEHHKQRDYDAELAALLSAYGYQRPT